MAGITKARNLLSDGLGGCRYDEGSCRSPGPPRSVTEVATLPWPWVPGIRLGVPRGFVSGGEESVIEHHRSRTTHRQRHGR